MPRVIKRFNYATRAIVVNGTVEFHSMGKYVTDYLSKIRALGWSIEDTTEADTPRDDWNQAPPPDTGRLPALTEPLSDELLLRLWRAVQGPQAHLNGPLIRFAGLVQEMAVPSASGRLPALDALLRDMRRDANPPDKVLISGEQVYRWATRLEALLAGLRADPARQLTEEQDDKASRGGRE